MKMDSPLEEWLIKEAGIRASGEWISSCVQWIAANNPHHLSPVELQRAVLERWLTTDIAESSLAILPSAPFSTLTNMALQVNWVCDVSTSAYRQLQLLRGEDVEAREEEGGTPAAKRAKEQVARPSRMLLAEVTDGHSVVNAIEYQPMGPTLREDIPPGTKVQVLAAVCKKGTILLVPGCLRVLGGGVESMAAVNSLESVLNRALTQAKCHHKQLSGQLSGGHPSGGSPKSASVPYRSGLMSPGQLSWGQRRDLPLRMQPPTSTSHAGNVEEHESANFTSLGGREANQHCSNQAGRKDPIGSPTPGPHSPWDTGATIPTRPFGHTPRSLPHGPNLRRSLSPQPHHRRGHSPGPHRPLSPGPHRPLSPGLHRPLSPGPHRPLPPGPHRPLSPGPHRPLSPGLHRPLSPGPHRPLPPGPHRPLSPGLHRPLSPGHRPLSPGPHRPLPPGPHLHRSLSPGPYPDRPLPPPPRLHRHHSPGPHPHRPPSPIPHLHKPRSPRPHLHSSHSSGPRPYRPHPHGVHTSNHLTPWDTGGSLPSQPGPRPLPHPQVDGREHARQHHNGGSHWPKENFPWTRDHRPAHPHHHQGFHSSGANHHRW